MTDCILWTGPLTDQGYGTITVEGRSQYAHRVAYHRSTIGYAVRGQSWASVED